MMTVSPSCRKRRSAPVGQRERLGAAPGQLQQAAAAALVRAADRAGGQQVAGPQVAAGDRVVRQLLVHRPVEVPEVAAADACAARRVAGVLQRHLERDVEAVSLRRAQVRQRRRILRAAARSGTARSASQRHDPGRDRLVAKFLALNGPSGWYSHFWMSRADQSLTSTRPKMRPRRASTASVRPARCRAADEEPHLQLEVQQPARPEDRRRVVGGLSGRAGGAPACRSTTIELARPW